jgi:hypothetical protein
MTYKTYRIGNICSMVKGTYPTMNTEPGEYPLVVTAEYRRSASTYQLEEAAVCVPLISSTGHGDAALHRVHYHEGKFALANLLVALIPYDMNFCNAKGFSVNNLTNM